MILSFMILSSAISNHNDCTVRQEIGHNRISIENRIMKIEGCYVTKRDNVFVNLKKKYSQI